MVKPKTCSTLFIVTRLLLVPSRILSTVMTVSGLVNSKAWLPCRSYGHPRPAIHWLRRNVTIAADERHTVHPNGTLLVYDLRRSDSGMYTCMAKNTGGSAEKTVFLDVHCKFARTFLTLCVREIEVFVRYSRTFSICCAN